MGEYADTRVLADDAELGHLCEWLGVVLVGDIVLRRLCKGEWRRVEGTEVWERAGKVGREHI